MPIIPTTFRATCVIQRSGPSMLHVDDILWCRVHVVASMPGMNAFRGPSLLELSCLSILMVRIASLIRGRSCCFLLPILSIGSCRTESRLPNNLGLCGSALTILSCLTLGFCPSAPRDWLVPIGIDAICIIRGTLRSTEISALNMSSANSVYGMLGLIFMHLRLLARKTVDVF